MFGKAVCLTGRGARTTLRLIFHSKGETMLAKVSSCAGIGLDGAVVDAEVDVSNGMPSFVIVGLPDTAVQESRERVQAAVKTAGLGFPYRRGGAARAPPAVP